MKDENKVKNAEGGNQGGRPQSQKKPPHRSKPYYITPSDKSQKQDAKPYEFQKQANAPKQGFSAVAQTASAEVGNNNAKAKDPSAGNGGNNGSENGQRRSRNRRKHRPNADKAIEPSEVKTPVANAPKEVKAEPRNNRQKSEQMPQRKGQRSDKLEMLPKKAILQKSNEPDKYADYEEFTVEELYGDKSVNDINSTATENIQSDNTADNGTEIAPTATADATQNMFDIVGIRFKPNGKTYYFAPCGISFKVGMHAIVRTSRGIEYGEVSLANTKIPESEIVPPLRTVVRAATDADMKHQLDNKAGEEEAFRLCNEKIISHGLDMKLIDAQYTFDNTKLLFYFTSSKRVDFRELVKDLASAFKTRIELRQVGIRDEAKMVGGLGPCGRPLCCSIFLSDFGQVSIKMAKEQNLSLNSSKISGICGRLMCCLRYEAEAYEYEIKRTPPVDTLVRTADGVGVITEISPIARTVKVKLYDSPDTPPKYYKRDEIKILKKRT